MNVPLQYLRTFQTMFEWKGDKLSYLCWLLHLPHPLQRRTWHIADWSHWESFNLSCIWSIYFCFSTRKEELRCEQNSDLGLLCKTKPNQKQSHQLVSHRDTLSQRKTESHITSLFLVHVELKLDGKIALEMYNVTGSNLCWKKWNKKWRKAVFMWLYFPHIMSDSFYSFIYLFKLFFKKHGKMTVFIYLISYYKPEFLESPKISSAPVTAHWHFMLNVKILWSILNATLYCQWNSSFTSKNTSTL